jgi:hypothetical protein
MSSMTSVPYFNLLQAMHRRQVRHAVLTSSRLSLDGIVQGTVDLAVAIDIAADNVTALVQALAEQGFRFARHAPSPQTQGAEVAVLTFTRGDDLAGDVHVVLVPPALWHVAGARVTVRGFDTVPVPVLPWDVLLRREDAPVRRPSRARWLGDAEVLN